MRPDEFKKLFDADKIGKISTSLVRDLAFYIGMKGIRNEDVPRFVPHIADYLNGVTSNQKNVDHKIKLKKLIDEAAQAMGIECLVAPVREELSTERRYRRLDSLARVLALNEVDTPCVAIALLDQEVVMSFNLPIKSDVDNVKALLSRKFDIVRHFLYQGSQLSDEGRLDEVQDLIKNTRMAILASGSHSQALLPTERRKRINMDKFLDVALGKLLTAVLKLPENGGFSDDDRDAIMSGRKIYLVPNREVETEIGASFHAEQVIANYISSHKPATSSVYVGISKLCCAACQEVLSDNPDVLFRGSHGMTFPNVMDTRTMRPMEYTSRTRLAGLSHAEDSDSEPESADYRSYQRRKNVKGEEENRLQQHSSRLFAAKVNDKIYSSEEEKPFLPQGGIIAAVK